MVTGQAGFPTVVVVNPPEQVALTSPVGATGVFELDLQPDLLLPFEGSGVDTQWMLELPHAANPFDFDSIADVMLTIEYTARSDPAYREQVMRQLARDGVAGERVLSLRQSYPDQWYALLNPVDPTALRTVSIELVAGDFPAGVTDLATTSVSVALRADGALPPMPIDLRLRGVGGAAETVDAIASTAGGSAPEWADLADGLNSPLGEWSITLDPVTGTLLDQEVIRDLLLSIGFRGEAPPWPG